MSSPAPSSVLTLGEVLLRLSTSPKQRLRNLPAVATHPAGAEANVARNLARLGHTVSFQTRLPDHALGRGLADELRRSGVMLDRVRWQTGGRLGTFFVQLADAPRMTEVIYDRAGSCATQMEPADLEPAAFHDCQLLHLSGITPALSATCAATAAHAVELARAAGALVSFDVNHRALLWTAETAGRSLRPFLASADIVFCSRRDARNLWQLDAPGNALLRQLQDLTPARHILCSDGANGVRALLDRSTSVHEPAVPVTIVDRLGAGDALAAGFLHGVLRENARRGLRYGVLMAALALTEAGDCPTVDAMELERLAGVHVADSHPLR